MCGMKHHIRLLCFSYALFMVSFFKVRSCIVHISKEIDIIKKIWHCHLFLSQLNGSSWVFWKQLKGDGWIYWRWLVQNMKSRSGHVCPHFIDFIFPVIRGYSSNTTWIPDTRVEFVSLKATRNSSRILMKPPIFVCSSHEWVRPSSHCTVACRHSFCLLTHIGDGLMTLGHLLRNKSFQTTDCYCEVH